MRSYNKDVEKQLGDLAFKKGVYKIRCVVNDRHYIGSTTQSFSKRITHHVSLLRSGKHKNNYLQNTWNKYGEGNFVYEVLEELEEGILESEQSYLDESLKGGLSLNINPLASGTPNMSKEAIKKRAETLKRRYREGSLEPTFKKGRTPWNKGKSGQYDTSYLRVPKRSTEKSKERVKKLSERFRENSKEIHAYTRYGDYLGKWRSSKDLEEWSLTDENLLPIYSRFKTPKRGGKPSYFLSSQNITRSAQTGKPYKGIYFTFINHLPPIN